MNHGITTTLSIVFFIAGIWLFSRIKSSKFGAGVFSILVFCSMVLFVAYAVATYFTGNGIDEATLYHLKYGLGGAGFFEYSWLIAVTTGVLMAGTFYLSKVVSKPKVARSSKPIYSFLTLPFIFTSLLMNPATIDVYRLLDTSWVSGDPSSQEIPASFYEYFKAPYIKKSDGQHKNVVFIYAESLERTYFDEALFPGLIKGLRGLESKSTYFTDIRQVASTGWTVAGMTASQCGVPLFTSSHGNSMSGMDQFLPSAVCLGDLLNQSGYELNYMGGASLDFAGKGKLFNSHGFDSVLGRDELMPQLDNTDYKTGWGLYDDSLFEMAYRRYLELSEAGDKFGLFMLTLDTHHPNGHPSASCKGTEYNDGSNEILNAVACSDYLITSFVERIAQSPYAEDTVVVVVSDHLAMRNTAYDRLSTADRRNLFMILDPDNTEAQEINSVGSTLDVGATLLPFLGYEGDIGFGRNLLNDEMSEADTVFIHTNLRRWKPAVTALWGFPEIKDHMVINVDNEFVSIDGRDFRMPILVELNDQLQSILKFQFYSSPGHKSLIEHRKQLKDDQYFLMIDECRNAKNVDRSLGEKGFCLLAGRGDEYTRITRQHENITYTADEIRQLLNITAKI